MTGAVYDSSGLISNDSTFISTFWHNLKHVQNRSINNSVSKDFKVQHHIVKIKREELEKISKRFNIKYCLAVLNSTFAKFFFGQVRRSAIGLYPDDIKKLPIKNLTLQEQKPFETLVDYIILFKSAERPVMDGVSNEQAAKAFEDLIDAMVLQLYFEQELHERGLEFIRPAQQAFTPIEQLKTDREKAAVVSEAYQILTRTNSELRKNLTALSTDPPEFVKVINKAG